MYDVTTGSSRVVIGIWLDILMSARHKVLKKNDCLLIEVASPASRESSVRAARMAWRRGAYLRVVDALHVDAQSDAQHVGMLSARDVHILSGAHGIDLDARSSRGRVLGRCAERRACAP